MKSFSKSLALSLVLAAVLGGSVRAGEIPCAALELRTANIERMLAGNWLRMQPRDVRKAWYRHLEHVETACEIQGECYFLGNATNLPGKGTEPSAGDCSESFVFDGSPREPKFLASVSMTQWFSGVGGAIQGAALMTSVIHPPEGACSGLRDPWSSLDRGRDCSWATGEGDWVLEVTVRVLHVGSVWASEFGISRKRF